MFTSVHMDFIQGVLGEWQHAHVWTEFLDERFENILCGGATGNTDTFCRRPDPLVLVEEAHDPIELIVLKPREAQDEREVISDPGFMLQWSLNNLKS